MDFDVKRNVNDNQQVSYTFRTFKSAEVRNGNPIEIVDKKETMTMGQLLDQKNNLMNLLSQLQERIDAATAAETAANQPPAGQPSTDGQPATPSGT